MSPFGVYVHIPFCRAKCDYCAFATWTDRHHLTDAYVESVRDGHPAGGRRRHAGGDERVRRRRHAVDAPGRALAGLLARSRSPAARGHGRVQSRRRDGRADARPTSTAGVNRVSLGVQSMAAHVLGVARAHPRPAQRRAGSGGDPRRPACRRSISTSSTAPRASRSPTGRRPWSPCSRSTRRTCPPTRLTIEPARRSPRSPTAIPTTTTRPTSTSSSTSLLAGAGLENYEISNWARPGHECRHNLLYWRQQNYRGFGCAAHSHQDGRRWWNVRTPDRYIELVDAGAADRGRGRDARRRRRASSSDSS